MHAHLMDVLEEVTDLIDGLPLRSHLPIIHQDGRLSLAYGVHGLSLVHQLPEVNRVHLVDDVLHLLLWGDEDLHMNIEE